MKAIRQQVQSSLSDRQRAAVATAYWTTKWRRPCTVKPVEGLFRFDCRAEGITVYSPSIGGLGRNSLVDTPMAFCRGYLPQRGDIVVDLGAGIGTESLLFSHLVGRQGMVISVEAGPTPYRALQRTLAAEGAENVKTYQVAVGNRHGTVHFPDETDEWRAAAIQDSSSGIAVTMKPLHSILGDADIRDNNVALLKCNIEGAEVAALEGLAEYARRIDHMAISCHDFLAQRNGEAGLRTNVPVRDWLRDNGYTTFDFPNRLPWLADIVYASRVG